MTVALSLLGGTVTGLVYGWGVHRMWRGVLSGQGSRARSAFVAGLLSRQLILLAVFGVAYRWAGADPLCMVAGILVGWTVSRRAFRPQTPGPDAGHSNGRLSV